jgi:hypothetical protein
MDVALPTNRRRVAELVGRLPDRRDDRAPRTRTGRDRTGASKGPIGEDGPCPRPKVLGRNVGPGRLAEVVIDVLRPDIANLAVLIDVLEQLLTGQLLATPHDRGQPAISKADLVDLATFRSESKAEPMAVGASMAIPERRQAERAVRLRVLLVADPDEPPVE